MATLNQNDHCHHRNEPNTEENWVENIEDIYWVTEFITHKWARINIQQDIHVK